jgi:hypothetical protein
MALILSPPPNDEDVQGVSWKQWFFKIRNQLLVALDLTNVSGILAPANGGTGSSDIPANGEVPIGNGTVYVPNTITAGSGVTITNGAGTITISAAGGGSAPRNVLIADTTIDTDTSYVLAGDLNLDGFTLTVNGNLGFV